MRHGVDAEFADELVQGDVARRWPGGRREHEFAFLGSVGLGEEVGAQTERHPVLPLRLHTLGRNGPMPGVEVDMGPEHKADLARACGDEDEKLEREFGGRVRGGECGARTLAWPRPEIPDVDFVECLGPWGRRAIGCARSGGRRKGLLPGADARRVVGSLSFAGRPNGFLQQSSGYLCRWKGSLL